MSETDTNTSPMCLRSRFWCASLEILQHSSDDWPSRFDQFDVLVARYGGLALGCAPTPRASPPGEPGWVGGPERVTAPGPRSYLIDWPHGERSSIHGHPDVMYVKVLSGRFLVEDFEVDTDGKLHSVASQVLSTGDRCAAHRDTQRGPSVIHRIECLDAGQTLHIYSDDASKAPRYGEADLHG
jgi:hypothetical protein